MPDADEAAYAVLRAIQEKIASFYLDDDYDPRRVIEEIRIMITPKAK